MKSLYPVLNQSMKLLPLLRKEATSGYRLFHRNPRLQFPIRSVVVEEKNEVVVVEYSNGNKDSFPWHFLQDNCTCPQCFHAASQSRKKRMTTLDLDKSVSGAKIIENENENDSSLHVTWSDGHAGTFSESWLQARSFSAPNCALRRKGFRDDPTLVDAHHQIKRLKFQEVLENSEQLLDCLSELSKVGVVMVENAPKSVGQLRKLSEKVGFIRTTHYGNEFTVRSIPNAVNLAYTAETLTVHTDLPYYAYPPGVQGLHCIKQFYGEEDEGVGGESHLVDGFIVARHMREGSGELRKQYDILCEAPVEFYDIGKDYTKFHKVHHSPTFVENPLTKGLDRIVYSNQQLSSYLPIELEKAQLLYRAMKTFTDLCYDHKYLMRFKLREGEILIFDNWRFLHGRSQFDASKGERHLEGCYFDWDEIFSTIRVIQSGQLLGK